MLIVVNKSGHEVAMVDPASRAVVARVPTGRGPHEVAVSPDGRRAYVSDYGVYNLFRDGETKSEPGHTVTVLDLEKRAKVATFDLAPHSRPHGIRVSRDGTRVWVTCEGSQTVLELDAGSGRIQRSWNTGQDVSHMVTPSADEAKLFVANIRSGSVTVIDRGTGRVTSLVTGAGAEGLDRSPDGREVWVTNRGANTITVLDAAHDSVLATFASGGEFPIRARFSPDGKEAWISNARSNAVVVFDAGSRVPLDTVAVGVMPIGLEMDPSGRTLYVACTNDDVVKVVDVKQREVVGEIRPGNEPDGMMWAPDRRTVPAGR